MTGPRLPLPDKDGLPPLPDFSEEGLPPLPSFAEPFNPSAPLSFAEMTRQVEARRAHEELMAPVDTYDPDRVRKLQAQKDARRFARGPGGIPSIGAEHVEETTAMQELGRFVTMQPNSKWWRSLTSFDDMSSAEDPTGIRSDMRSLIGVPASMMQSIGGPTVGEGMRVLGDPGNAGTHALNSLGGMFNFGSGFVKGLYNGFVGDVIRLDYDRHNGGGNLLPEERVEMQKNAIMNYGGLALGALSRGMIVERQALNQIGRELGVGTSAIRNVLTQPEVEMLTQSVLEESAGMRFGLRGRITAGVQEGVVAGVGGAVLADQKPGEILAYGLMAAPLGVAFEMAGTLASQRGARHTAKDYVRIRQLQAMDDPNAAAAAMAALSLHLNVELSAQPAEGMTRVYHGAETGTNGAKLFTTDEAAARASNDEVTFVDLPNDHPSLSQDKFELPADVEATRQPLVTEANRVHPEEILSIAQVWAAKADMQLGERMILQGVDRVHNARLLQVIEQNGFGHVIHENPNGTLDLFVGNKLWMDANDVLGDQQKFKETGFLESEIVMYDGRPHVIETIGKSRTGEPAQSVVLRDTRSGGLVEVNKRDLTRPPRLQFREPPIIFRTELADTKAVDDRGNPLLFYRGIPSGDNPFRAAQYNGELGPATYAASNPWDTRTFANFRRPTAEQLARMTPEEMQRVDVLFQAVHGRNVAATMMDPITIGMLSKDDPIFASMLEKLGQSPRVIMARAIVKNPFIIKVGPDYHLDSLAPTETLQMFLKEMELDKHLEGLRYDTLDPNSEMAMDIEATLAGAEHNIESIKASLRGEEPPPSMQQLYTMLQDQFGVETNDVLRRVGGHDSVIRYMGDTGRDAWIAAFDGETQFVQPWTVSETMGIRTGTTKEMVDTRLKEMADALIEPLKERLDSDEPIKFDDLVQKMVAVVGARPNEVPFLSNLIESRLREEILPEVLDAKEMDVRKALLTDLQFSRQAENLSLVDRALNAGMLLEREGGTIVAKNMNDGNIVGRFSSVEEANEFMRGAGAQDGVHLDGGVPTVPPRVVGGGLFSNGVPEQGPHTVKFVPAELGIAGRVRTAFNAGIGKHFTTMREYLIALDEIHSTDLLSSVYLPLQEGALAKNAAMLPVLKELHAVSNLAAGLGRDAVDNVVTWIETMSPEEVVNKLYTHRTLSETEIGEAAWFVEHTIDIGKIFEYRREQLKLEKNLNGQPEDFIRRATTELQDQYKMTATDIEASARLGRAITSGNPEFHSAYAIVRLANSMMGQEKSRAEFMAHLGEKWTPQMQTFADEIEKMFAKGAKEFDIPDARRLTNYFSHYRKYDLNESVPKKDGSPRFVSDLQRVGEMSELDRDPISVLVRYYNTGFGERYLSEPLRTARKSLDKIAMDNPQWGPQLRETVTNNYVNEVRGVPRDNVGTLQKFIEETLHKIGIKSFSGARDMTNTLLSLSSSAALGYRPMQAARDFSSFLSIYYTRFGTARTARMLNTINKWTPRQLYEAGILKSEPGSTGGIVDAMFRGPDVAQVMAEQGVIATNSPVRVLSAAEQQQGTLFGKASKARQAVQKLADVGMDWSFQHTVYQWAHAATYLEAFEHTANTLQGMMAGIGKEKAYKQLKLSTYDRTTQVQFDALVKAGDFEAASKFLARVTAGEVIPTFGLGNAPIGWTSNVGRLIGQFGFYPTWARSQISRMMVQGTLRDRMGAMARMAAVSGATKLASGALGLSMASWYLPYAAGAVDAVDTFKDALNTPQGTNTRNHLLARAMWKGALGVPGSAMFGGGPSTTIVRSALTLGDMTQANDDGATAQMARLWMLGIPGSYQVRDFARAYEMQQMGYNPTAVFATAFGLSLQNVGFQDPDPQGLRQNFMNVPVVPKPRR